MKVLSEAAYPQVPETAVAQDDRRREAREDVPGWTVRIDGETFPLKDWSAMGFLASAYTDDKMAGDKVDVTFSVPAATGFEFSAQAVVVRIDKKSQELAAEFVTNVDKG